MALGALTWAPNPEGQIDGPQITGILVNYWHNFQCKMSHERLTSALPSRVSGLVFATQEVNKAIAKHINSFKAKLKMIGWRLRRNKGWAEASSAKLHGGSSSGQTYCRCCKLWWVGQTWCQLHGLTECNLWWNGQAGTTDTLYAANFEGHRLHGPQAMLQWYSLSSHPSWSSSYWSWWISMRRLRQIICCWQCPSASSKLRCSVIANRTPPTYILCCMYNIVNLNKINVCTHAYVRKVV